MALLYLVPRWFFGFDVFLELVFALVTLGVSLYSLRIYYLSGQRECKVFGAGFLLISFAYLIWSGLNLFISARFGDGARELSFEQITYLGTMGVYAYVLFFTLGLATLAYMTLGSKRQLTYVLVATLSVLAIVFSSYKALAFYFISSFLLLFVVMYYVDLYRTTRRNSNFFVLVAFVLLFLGTVDFIFAALHNVHYVIGHILSLIGYGFILVSFISTLRS